MSVRLGIGWPVHRRAHQVDEPVEEVRRVVRAGGRLRVVLDAERRPVEQLEPLDDIVVEADVADLGAAVRRLGHLVERRVDREAVVVRGDLDLAGRAVLDRLVDAAVTVPELVRAEAERAAEDLVAEADAEQRQPASSTPACSATASSAVAGSPGPLEKNTPSGSSASTSSAVAVAGSTCTSMPRSAMRCGVMRLDAEVDGGDGEPLLADRGDDVRLAGGDLARTGPRRPSRALPARARAAPRRPRPRSPEKMPTRIAPRSRRCRVSARVSMPLMPTTPCSTSSSSRERRERQLDGMRAGSRTT